MIQFIAIDNFALIDHLDAQFERGLNLITGETGSGKSILVDAVGLLVGARASQEMIRLGSDAACIEGVCRIADSPPAKQLLEEAEIEPENGELIIRREITRSGSNRVFLNGRLTTLGFLTRLGQCLVDIHGQHSQQVLLQPSSHLGFLDAFDQNQELSISFREAFDQLTLARKRLALLERSERERLQRLDLLTFQKEEIERLQLTPDLDERLGEEEKLLSSAERRMAASQAVNQLLYEADPSAVGLLEQASRQMTELSQLDKRFSASMAKLEELRFQVEELAFEARDYAAAVEFNSTRLDQIEEQMSAIEKAKRKYGRTIGDILAYLKEISDELDRFADREKEIGLLREQLGPMQSRALRLARKLSARREAGAKRLCAAVEKELRDLAMRNVRFEVQLRSDEGELTEQGIDQAEFLISPNLGEEPRPIARTASGGELSRIMLALKSVLKVEQFPGTFVFDEVDAGIGGRVATSLGEKLSRLAQRHQVFCVTHLPQVAAFASQHFHVGKKIEGRRTLICLQRLDEAGRIEELSRMLAGEAVSETTRRQAAEMLEKAHLPNS